MELSQQEFNSIREFVYEICGLAISDEKQYLVQQRLEPLVREAGCDTFGAFHQKMSQHCPMRMREQIITTMTTHETSFFRDEHFFEAFRDEILPSLANLIVLRATRPRVRIWSAASSTGQEPYSIAMLIHEFAQANRHRGIDPKDFEILATDISVEVLTQAMKGEYKPVEIGRGLPDRLREKYFREEGGVWFIDECIRQMVEFRQINLVNPISMLGSFDVIFCRNVLIYFDDTTKASIFDQCAQMLDNDGYLILGATENTFQTTRKFESERHGQALVYRKRPLVGEVCG